MIVTISPDSLDRAINRLRQAAGVTGISVTVFNKGTLAYQKAFGYAQIEKQLPLQNRQVFYVASLSKAVFGYLVAQLVMEGKLKLDKPLVEYVNFTKWTFNRPWRGYDDIADDERYTKITARMCLSHSTDFQNWRFLTARGFDEEAPLVIRFEPGSWYAYSGEGMVLLQYVIEHLMDKELETLAMERIFIPLSMSNTSYVWEERFATNYCNGQHNTQEVLPKDTEDEGNAAGCMETTQEDYARFLSHLFLQPPFTPLFSSKVNSQKPLPQKHGYSVYFSENLRHEL